MSERAIWILTRLRARLPSLLAFLFLARLAGFVILTPIATAILRYFLYRTGRVSVGNFEIASFLLSPRGLLALLLLGTIYLATLWLEQAGLMLILSDRRRGWLDAARAIALHFPQLARLGLRQFVGYLIVGLPAAFLTLLAIKALWSGRDLNGLIVLKPPIFWTGVAIAGVILVTAGAIILWLTLRWLFSIPAILFEPGSTTRTAMNSSIQRTLGRRRPMAVLYITWLAIATLVSMLIAAALRTSSGWILSHAGESLSVLLPLTAIVLIADLLISALVSTAFAAALAGLTLWLYRDATGITEPDTAPEAAPRAPRRTRLLVLVGILLLTLGTGIVCRRLLSRLALNDRVEISAHRAGGAVAPENSFAALRLCIEHGADWVETDVQRTADNNLIILHDTDVFRIDGSKRRVQDVTLADLKLLDLKAFNDKFEGERIPTLEEYIAAAGGRIRFNIELKPHGEDDWKPLTEMTVAAIQRAGIQSRTRICSQSYEAIRLAKELEPSLQIGYIAGAAVGNLSALDVDFLMVSGSLATRRLTDHCRARGIEVHAWTINHADQVLPLLDRGVANIITDDTVLIRTRLEELRNLHPAERLLLRVRNYLAE